MSAVSDIPNWQNRTLFHHDNLGIMRGMNSNSVHLIATDPPFNKSRDFHATPDSLASGAVFHDRWSWDKDIHPDWKEQIQDDWPGVWLTIDSAEITHSEGMAAFLCYMAVRLVEMHRILRPDGSIYLHCDPTASHYLKMIMDAIFGKGNFRNEIVWCYRGGGVSLKDFARKHDILLRYSKTKDVTFDVDSVRIPYSKDVVNSPISRYDKSYRSNKVYMGYRPNPKGKHPEDWWTIQPIMPSDKQERTGYPTQKPVALYERIVKASSNPGDIVLDPFCGCATTLVAAEKLGRQWVGIDIWDEAHETVLARLAQYNLAVQYGKNVKLSDIAYDIAQGTNYALPFSGNVHYEISPPQRTDDGQVAAPPLKVKTRRYQLEPPGPRMSRAEMLAVLIDQHGCVCQGCGLPVRDERYLDLDHNLPRSQGGINHISNRVPLCPPCNKTKSNTLTIEGLR